MKWWVKNIIASGILTLVIILLVPIPGPKDDYSRIMYDRHGELMAAHIASDEQWRFPLEGELPERLKMCIRYYEDEYFYWHPGVNPFSIMNAAVANLKAGKIVRGGSTLNMQVVRMARGNRPRTFLQKAIECLGAIKLELLYSKNEIYTLWAGMAPMGGNTVGVSAAARRYFGRPLENLSLAEYATLAVLPNSPSAVHFGKNISVLKSRRDFLLQKLYEHDMISDMDLKLSISEPVPSAQLNLPAHAFHYLSHHKKHEPEEYVINSTMDLSFQKTVQSIVDNHSVVYQADGINNMSALVIDNHTNELLAYVGNSASVDGDMRYVDCVQAKRSYGSLLKPILYAYAIENGYFLPLEAVKDIPTNINGYTPKNFDLRFRGEVSFDKMVSHSLNVPAVRVLNYVGLQGFHRFVRNDLQINTINPNADHHGLSLILGGAEASLWDMARIYKGLAMSHQSLTSPFSEMQATRNEQKEKSNLLLSRVSVDHTLKAMSSLERPEEEQHFTKYSGAKVAWKTGTSYGHRDAWAIGVTSEYTVAVWVGNENNDGMYDLIGARKAAPVLFKIFGSLPDASSFSSIQSNRIVDFCTASGRLAGRLCPKVGYIGVAGSLHQLRQCQGHVTTQTKSSSLNRQDTVYQMDPVVAYYHDRYFGKPRAYDENNRASTKSELRIVYPEKDTHIFIPKKISQDYSEVRLSAYLNGSDQKVFWYLNGRHIKTTVGQHRFSLDIPLGTHELYIVSSSGEEDRISFDVSRRSGA